MFLAHVIFCSSRNFCDRMLADQELQVYRPRQHINGMALSFNQICCIRSILPTQL